MACPSAYPKCQEQACRNPGPDRCRRPRGSSSARGPGRASCRRSDQGEAQTCEQTCLASASPRGLEPCVAYVLCDLAERRHRQYGERCNEECGPVWPCHRALLVLVALVRLGPRHPVELHCAPHEQQDRERKVLEDEEVHPQMGEPGRLARVTMHGSRLCGIRSDGGAEEIDERQRDAIREGLVSWSHFHEAGPCEAQGGAAHRPHLSHAELWHLFLCGARVVRRLEVVR